jgi:EmrB/QacA subfamily drug resistance transporter
MSNVVTRNRLSARSDAFPREIVDERVATTRTDDVARRPDQGKAPVEPGTGSDRPGAAKESTERHSVRRTWVRRILFGLLPLVLIAGAYGYVTGGRIMSTDDAYVEARKVAISTDVSGIVSDVDVADNQHVLAGQVVYHLDARQFRIALDNAKANLAQIGLSVDAMKGDYNRMLKDAAAQQAQVDLDQVTYDREAALLSTANVPKATFDQARYTLQADKQKLASLQQQAAVQRARLGGNPDIPTTQHPQYLQAQAQVAEALGGWLTENYSWRYVFYINLPIGALGLLGMATFLPDFGRTAGAKLDWFGFGTLSVAIGAMQIALDRGEIKDWFGSGEIILEAVIAASAFYLFLVHTFTAEKPFVRPALFRNRNFVAGIVFIFVVGLTYYASMALQPPYLQGLMNYPVVTAGLVMGPRGVGTMISMMVVGRLVGPVDTRILLGIGLGVTAWSFYAMTGWTPDVPQWEIVKIGVVQGAGLGFLFVPLSAVTLSTLPAEQRTEGAGLYSLSRNIGSSLGISVVNALVTQNTQVNHAGIAQHVTAVNGAFQAPSVHQLLDPMTAAGRAALDALVSQQAQIIAYIDDYRFLMVSALLVIPLLLIFKTPASGRPSEHVMAGE